MKSSFRSFLKVMLTISMVFSGFLFPQQPSPSNDPGALKPESVNIPFFTTALDSQYHNYEKLDIELNKLTKLYPGLTRLDTIGYAQQFKRCIWAMKVSKNAEVEEDEPIVLFIGNIHANEIFGVEMCSMLMNELLESYGKDSAVTRLLDNTAVWFIPTMNPDGYHAVTSGICSFWRKNGRDDNNNGIFYENTKPDRHEGVDLNRNFGYRWPGPETNFWSGTYCGEVPFSESESRAIRDFATVHSVQLSVSMHSWSEVVMYPYWIGTIPWIGTWIPVKDDSVVYDIADNMGRRMKTMQDTTKRYYVDNSMTDGFMDSWFYKEYGTYQFLIEMLPYPLFVIPGDQLKTVYNETKGGFMYLIERAHGPGLTGHITDKKTGKPLYAEVRVLQAYEPQAGARMTMPVYGRYYHYLKPGKYDVSVVKFGYYQKDFKGVIVGEGGTTVLDASLEAIPLSVAASGTKSSYSLEQNYPNPFNPVTTISYEMPYSGHVDLKIYDMLGKEVKSLQSGYMPSGIHRVSFDAGGLPSGIYICRISVLSEEAYFEKSIKMTFMK